MIAFGTDGIRGILGSDYDSIFLYKLGRALKVLDIKRAVIGMDPRISSDLYMSLIISGMLTVGIECYRDNIVPTAALINYSLNHNMLGVMITASHNPYYYNGVKIVKCGKKLNSDEENSILNFIKNDDNNLIYGSLYNCDILAEYYNILNKHVVKSNLNILIDCANGCASNICYKIFKPVCNRLDIINDNPSGLNINRGCGSNSIDNLKKYIRLNDYDLGIAFDGDADRLIICDSLGQIFDGDLIIYIFAKYLNINSVVLSKMCNLGVIDALNKLGIKVYEADVGDKNILNKMNELDIKLGGEPSGHIINKYNGDIGDGILNALDFIKLLVSNNIDLNNIYNEVSLYKSLSYDLILDDINKYAYKRIDEILNNEKNIKIILRRSGTQNIVRLMVMSKRLDICLKYIEEIKSILVG